MLAYCMCLFSILQHTSASLAINENADPTVRGDLERHFNVLAPEGAPYFQHTYEGADDMPAHIKSTLIGSSQSIPITHGRLNLGIWQGLYLCEHRDHASARTIIITLQGE
jgi:secondary thiamine-phosphate synthase enzyme